MSFGADQRHAAPDVDAIELAPDEHEFGEPTQRASWGYIIALLAAQFVFFIALLGPAIVAIQVKAINMFPDDAAAQASTVQVVTMTGAVGALLANVIFGQLSDRTMSKWGRRRPWIVAGVIVMTGAFVLMGYTQSTAWLTVGWFVAQVGANAVLAPFIATLADQVPLLQRAKVSSWLGMAQNVAVLVATFLAQKLSHNMPVLFIVPSLFAIAFMIWFAVALPDQVRHHPAPPMNLKEFAHTFWVSPVEHPDYALAWFGRFLITLGSFMFTTYRVLFLVHRLGLTTDGALGVVTISVLIYTATLVVASYVSGLLSDHLGRRKIFVFIASAVFGLGLGLLAHTNTIGQFYLVEALMGLAYGIYVGVDLALVIDVLPNPDNSGKDLGVFNIANALPQSLGPALAGALIKVGNTTATNYTLMCWVAAAACVLGAILVIPIKKVK